MMSQWVRFVVQSLVFLSLMTSAQAVDFVRLKNGALLRCAVLRQDTVAVFTTDWASRHQLQPPLQVYTRDEIESIWFEEPSSTPRRAIAYRPRASGVELGGGLAFQTWAETRLIRRQLLQMSLQCGLNVVPQFGFELDGGLTMPMSGKSDSTWDGYKTAYQITLNVVLQPVTWNGLVPFGLIGGGVAIGTPVHEVSLTKSGDIRNLVNVGLGVKWGFHGAGIRLEWRHHYYSWTPDKVVGGIRTREQAADASVIRAGLFVYR